MTDSPHLAAMSLGVRAIERRGGFEDAVRTLLRAREEADREVALLRAARDKGRAEGVKGG